MPALADKSNRGHFMKMGLILLCFLSSTAFACDHHKERKPASLSQAKHSHAKPAYDKQGEYLGTVMVDGNQPTALAECKDLACKGNY